MFFFRMYRKDGGQRVRQCQLATAESHPLAFAGKVGASLLEDERGKVNEDQLKKVPEKVVKKKAAVVITAFDGLDPLSAALSAATASTTAEAAAFSDAKPSRADRIVDDDGTLKRPTFIEEDFIGWSVHRGRILNKFNTAEKSLSIRSSFLAAGSISTSSSATITTISKSTSSGLTSGMSSSISQKVRDRLEELDDFEDGQLTEMGNLSQPEYVKRIEELKTALSDAWEADQKVKALKIAIQCAKQLSSTAVIQYYPSKFALISDVLDTFGRLVYRRLHNKATGVGGRPEEIPLVQETCRNWFYKISSIRELLPRFYIEASILKVYSFLVEEGGSTTLNAQYEAVFNRLLKMVRGIGDPLVATYCRVYLSRVAIDLCPIAKGVFTAAISDTFSAVANQLSSRPVQQTLNGQKVDYLLYYTLFTPALDWMLTCSFYRADSLLFGQVLNSFKAVSTSTASSPQNGCCSALLLNSLLTAYPPSFILTHILVFMDFIKHVDKDCLVDDGHSTVATSVYPQSVLLKELGESLKLGLVNVGGLGDYLVSPDERRQLLTDVWKITRKLGKSRPAEYLAVLETWSEIVAKQYDLADINDLLGDVVSALAPGRSFESHSAAIFTVLSKVVTHGCERFHYSAFFSLPSLMSYLDLLHGGGEHGGQSHLRVDACKLLVEAFTRSFSQGSSLSGQENGLEGGNGDNASEALTTSDPVILNSLTFLCKTMHDTISALTLEDDKRQIGGLIIAFLRRVSYGRDFEAQLNFYVEARASFSSHLDPVLAYLVQSVNRLAMETHSIVGGHHTKRTIAFVNGCIAFAYITVPSIEEITVRLTLYLASAQVALVNVCLPQTDAFLKAAITLLRQLPPTSEAADGKLLSNDEFLSSYVSTMLSTLLVVPVSFFSIKNISNFFFY